MADSTRLRIAYLCDYTPLNRNLYSGGNARIYDALQAHAGDVTILGQSWHMAEPVRKLIMSMRDSLNLRIRWRAHLLLSNIIARGVQAELKKSQFDVLFGAYSFQSMARITPPYPMVQAFTSDATPTTYKQSEVGQSFGSFLPAARLLDPWVLRRETEIFSGLDLMLWPSEWLKTGAEQLYGLCDDQSVVVPWGANVPDPGPAVQAPVLSKDAPVEILFIGRDWFAKGGPLVFDTVKALKERGVSVRLNVIGCQPPDFHLNEAVNVIGSLDKAVPADLAQFQDSLRQAHFIVMPSFESYGFAFCEASAYGLPSLCLRVGGVPVRDGINGHALPVGSGTDEFADVICKYLANPGSYQALRDSTREEYQNRLNWDSWGQRTAKLLHDRTNRLRR